MFLSPLGKARSEPLASFSVPTLPLAWTAVSLRQAGVAGTRAAVRVAMQAGGGWTEAVRRAGG